MIAFTTSPRCINGLFAVPKDADTDRLIIDARPCNALFVDPEPVQLPSPELVTRFALPHHSDFFVAKTDLKNFYHHLLLPEWMWPFFSLPGVQAADVGMSAEFATTALIYPCCKTLPMGSSHSVLLAQTVHEFILDHFTPLLPADRLTSDSDTLLDRPRHLVYIDDLVLFGLSPQPLAHLQSAYARAVSTIGFPINLTKSVPPTCDPVECLGLEVDGLHRTVGLSPAKLQRLVNSTLLVLRQGFCTGDYLSTIVGKWTWACMARRPALSVFAATYRFIRVSASRIFSIWPSVHRELNIICGLAPLLFSNISLPWWDRLVASDASSTGLGVVFAESNPDATESLAQTRLPISVPSVSWTTSIASRWRKPEHINVLELRAITTALRWALSFPSLARRRLLLLSDSSVAVCAVSKGRSSSYQILQRLRFLSSLVLAAGLQLSIFWIPTSANPADAASRI